MCCCIVNQFKGWSIISTLSLIAVIVCSGVAINVGNNNLYYCPKNNTSYPMTPQGQLSCTLACPSGSSLSDTCVYFSNNTYAYYGGVIAVCVLLLIQNLYWSVINDVTKFRPAEWMACLFWCVSILCLIALIGVIIMSAAFSTFLFPVKGASIAATLFSLVAFIAECAIVHIIRIQYSAPVVAYGVVMPSNGEYASYIPPVASATYVQIHHQQPQPNQYYPQQ